MLNKLGHDLWRSFFLPFLNVITFSSFFQVDWANIAKQKHNCLNVWQHFDFFITPSWTEVLEVHCARCEGNNRLAGLSFTLKGKICFVTIGTLYIIYYLKKKLKLKLNYQFLPIAFMIFERQTWLFLHMNTLIRRGLDQTPTSCWKLLR